MSRQTGRTILTGTLGLALALAGSLATAQQAFRYNYVEAAYIDIDVDDVDVDGDGIGLNGSLALTPNVHALVEYADAELDGGGLNDVDFKTWKLALGYNHALQPGLDFVGRIGYVDAELDVPGFGSADEDGYSIEALFRWMASEQLELNGGLEYVDLDDSDTAVVLGAVLALSNSFALIAGIDFADDVTTWNLGGRFYFDVPAKR